MGGRDKYTIDEAEIGTIAPGQSAPENNGNEEVLHISQSSMTVI